MDFAPQSTGAATRNTRMLLAGAIIASPHRTQDLGEMGYGIARADGQAGIADLNIAGPSPDRSCRAGFFGVDHGNDRNQSGPTILLRPFAALAAHLFPDDGLVCWDLAGDGRNGLACGNPLGGHRLDLWMPHIATVLLPRHQHPPDHEGAVLLEENPA